MNVFIDSDVVISALLSSTGAAHVLIHHDRLKSVISSISFSELQIVAKRLGIKSDQLETLIESRFSVLKISQSLQAIKQEYGQYVGDINDAHIVAGARSAGVKYLISYNLKHFKTDRIKSELDILIITPALFMQFLRSN